ncbi:protein neprosin-like [Cannabis sativa]|uniref:protein neprosin-like n=1 Tax=Cannabis sativa TaxID=3483 RepID=UPI0029C9FCC9|nr:protein neprosin-like [Cannabis sativa]
MAIRAIFLITIVCYISYYCNAFGDYTTKLSRLEELEIEKELNLLNKPPIKTIKREDGVIYDCIDFFKQPAFDHPSLKNHTYHYKIKPSSRPNLSEHKDSSKIKLKGLNCPIGTVPIRRTTKEDLIKSKLFTKVYGSLTLEKPGLHHAVLRTISDPKRRYNGGGAVMSIYNPTVAGSQYSSSQMTIKNGPDSIQVGWTVNPTLYGDSKTHAFTFLQAGGNSCFNTQCPGFVIVSTEIPLDYTFDQVSQRGETIYDTQFFIYRDPTNGNWWLEYGKAGTQIGFWPGRIFSALNTDLASYMEWGGEAYSPPGQPNPEMGNGFRTTGDQKKDSFIEQMTTVDESHKQVIFDNAEVFIDAKKLYSVDDWKIRGDHGHVMSFGGPFFDQ